MTKQIARAVATVGILLMLPGLILLIVASRMGWGGVISPSPRLVVEVDDNMPDITPRGFGVRAGTGWFAMGRLHPLRPARSHFGRRK